VRLCKLASAITKAEGKKSQAKICDVREVLGILSELIAKHDGKKILAELRENGLRRLRRKSARGNAVAILHRRRLKKGKKK